MKLSIIHLFFYGAVAYLLNNGDNKGIKDSEKKIIKEIIESTGPSKNLIIIESNLDITCSNFTCEKYSEKGIQIKINGKNTEKHLQQISSLKNGVLDRNDIFVLKIVSFGQNEIDTLTAMKKNNAKSYVVIFAENDHCFSQLKKYIPHKNMFNVYLIKRVENSRVYLLYQLCAFCNSGKHQWEIYNEWKMSMGFRRRFQFIPSFKGKFFGANLKVGALKNPPNTFVIGSDKDGSLKYGGQLYWFLETIAMATDFKPQIIEPENRAQCLYDERNNTFTGFCQMLLNDEVDMGGFPAGLSYELNVFFDYIGVFHMARNRLISAQPKKKMETKMQFKLSVLVVILTASAVFLCVMLFIELLGGNRRIDGYFQVFFTISSILFLEAMRFKKMKGFRTIIIGAWIITCFFIVVNVIGDITSISVAGISMMKEINSIEDLKERNISWIQYPFINTEDTLWKELPEQSKFRKIMYRKEGLEYVLKNPTKYVYVFPKEAVDSIIRIHFWDGNGENPFHFSPPVRGSSPIMACNYVKKGSSYAEILYKKSLSIEAAGLYRGKFMVDTVNLLVQSNTLHKGGDVSNNKVLKRIVRVDLKSLKMVLLVWIGLVAISMFVFFLEVCSGAIFMDVSIMRGLRVFGSRFWAHIYWNCIKCSQHTQLWLRRRQ